MNTILESVDKIKKAVKALRDLHDETAQMDAMEERARRDFDSAAEEGRLDDPKIRRKISDAQQSVDVVKARRGAVNRGIRNQEPILMELVRDLDLEWANFINAFILEVRKRKQEALRPFYPGDERGLQIDCEHDTTPLEAEFARAHINLAEPLPTGGLLLIGEAVTIARHVQKFLKKPEFASKV